MTDFIVLAAPGALTWLTVYILTKTEKESQVHQLIGFFFYCGVDMGLFWAFRAWQSMADGGTAEEIMLVDKSGAGFWQSMLIALVAGAFFSILRMFDAGLQVSENDEAWAGRLSRKARIILKALLACVSAVIILGAVLRPVITSRVEQNRESSTKKYVTGLLDKVSSDVEAEISSGTDPESLKDLTYDDLNVARVDRDQNWRDGTGKDRKEAVYMTDGEGKVVYFSYRDKYYAATWSGPTEDQEFLDSHGGWNKGKGFGWTGKLMK